MSGGQSSRFIFEPARESDGGELLNILEEAAFKGNISLLYTRRPDAYRSLKQEAKDVRILLTRDTERNIIAGFGACALRELFVNGRPEMVAYLFSLRVARNYMKKAPLLHRGFSVLHEQLQGQPLCCTLTTILDENLSAQKLLEKPRAFMPAYLPLGRYHVFASPCSKSRHSKRLYDTPFECRRAQNEDSEKLAHFLCDEGRKYQFFPVVTAEELRAGSFYGLACEDFFILSSRDGEILAAGALWDQQHYKQYLVQSYGGVLKFLRPFSGILPFFGYPSLPAPGSILAFSTLSFWAVKNTEESLFEQFLNGIAQHAGHHSFMLIGLHEKHPFHSVLKKRPHISYKSKVYRVSWEKDQQGAFQLDAARVPYLECGLL